MNHKDTTLRAWIRQPLSLLCKDGGLSKPAAIVLAIVIDRATDTDPPQPVQLQQDLLAWQSGYTTRTVKRAIAELVQRELLAVHRTGRGSVYTLTGAVELLPPKRAAQSESQGARPSRARGSARRSAADEQLDEYLSVVNRFKDDTDYSSYVCSEPANESSEGYL